MGTIFILNVFRFFFYFEKLLFCQKGAGWVKPKPPEVKPNQVSSSQQHLGGDLKWSVCTVARVSCYSRMWKFKVFKFLFLQSDSISFHFNLLSFQGFVWWIKIDLWLGRRSFVKHSIHNRESTLLTMVAATSFSHAFSITSQKSIERKLADRLLLLLNQWGRG